MATHWLHYTWPRPVLRPSQAQPGQISILLQGMRSQLDQKAHLARAPGPREVIQGLHGALCRGSPLGKVAQSCKLRDAGHLLARGVVRPPPQRCRVIQLRLLLICRLAAVCRRLSLLQAAAVLHRAGPETCSQLALAALHDAQTIALRPTGGSVAVTAGWACGPGSCLSPGAVADKLEVEFVQFLATTSPCLARGIYARTHWSRSASQWLADRTYATQAPRQQVGARFGVSEKVPKRPRADAYE
jgi:hypothetical protein